LAYRKIGSVDQTIFSFYDGSKGLRALAKEANQFLSVLGEGAVGVVYEAFDRERNERVALKTLRTSKGETLRLLKNEFRSVQDLSHPNLVELGEMFEDALATLLRGCIAAARGKDEIARGELERATELLRAADMPIHAAAAELRLGRLVGGEAGAARSARADAALREHGLMASDRWVDLLAPVGSTAR
jgi:hypothetical protein